VGGGHTELLRQFSAATGRTNRFVSAANEKLEIGMTSLTGILVKWHFKTPEGGTARKKDFLSLVQGK
jgi:hypothetical protein